MYARRAPLLLFCLLALVPVIGKAAHKSPPTRPRVLQPKPTAPEKVAPSDLIDSHWLETTISASPNPATAGQTVQITVLLHNRSTHTPLLLIFHYAQSPVSWRITTTSGELVYASLTPRTPLAPSYHVERLAPGESAAFRFVWRQTVRYRDDDGRLVRRKTLPSGSFTITARLKLDSTYYSNKEELKRRIVLHVPWVRR